MPCCAQVAYAQGALHSRKWHSPLVLRWFRSPFLDLRGKIGYRESIIRFFVARFTGAPCPFFRFYHWAWPQKAVAPSSSACRRLNSPTWVCPSRWTTHKISYIKDELWFRLSLSPGVFLWGTPPYLIIAPFFPAIGFLCAWRDKRGG